MIAQKDKIVDTRFVMSETDMRICLAGTNKMEITMSKQIALMSATAAMGIDIDALTEIDPQDAVGDWNADMTRFAWQYVINPEAE